MAPLGKSQGSLTAGAKIRQSNFELGKQLLDYKSTQQLAQDSIQGQTMDPKDLEAAIATKNDLRKAHFNLGNDTSKPESQSQAAFLNHGAVHSNVNTTEIRSKM